jgi:hypothetical protein
MADKAVSTSSIILLVLFVISVAASRHCDEPRRGPKGLGPRHACVCRRNPLPQGLRFELYADCTLASPSSYRLGETKETKFNTAFAFIVNGLETMGGARKEGDGIVPDRDEHAADITASVRPSEAQRRYLARGLSEPGGKLPLFDADGREVPKKTIEACIAHGWADVWFNNPTKPDWLVCRLTPEGYRALGQHPPKSGSSRPPR